MNLDTLLIKLFLSDTSLYHKYSKYLGIKSNSFLIKVYHALHVLCENEASVHTSEDLAVTFHTLYPVLTETDASVAADLFQNLTALETPEKTKAEELLRQLAIRASATSIAQTAISVASGESEIEDLTDALDALQHLDIQDEKQVDESFITTNIVKLHEERLTRPPYRFRLKTLNAILGGLHKRTFGFIFARPEAGKTQFLASEVSFIAEQVEGCILWINNEEDGSAIVPRLYQAALHVTQDHLYDDVGQLYQQYSEKIGEKIRIYDNPAASVKDLERVIKDTKPDVIVIDQLDKIRGFGDDDRYDLVQKAKYQWAREIAKRFNCAVIGVCQAGGSAENKKYLDMSDVDSSKTAKQGEADWMLGIGFIDKDGEEFRRYLSFCKNKLPYVDGMILDKRHAKVPVISIPEYQIYEDAINVVN